MSHDHGPRRTGFTRRALLRTGISLGAAAHTGGSVWAETPGLTEEMARAVRSWIDMLSDAQKKKAQRDWQDGREDWHYVPRSRPGLPLGEMDDRQSSAVWALLSTLLSERGLDRLRSTLKVEAILGELTGQPDYRDPENYALVLFGDPSTATPWAWRFEGHHLSLNTIVVPGIGLSVTPVFYGSNPGTVPQGHNHAGFRLLGAEEDAAFGLIRSLEGDMRNKAIIGDRSLGDIVAGPGRETALKQFEGVSVAALTEAQRESLMRIVQLYARTMREEIAEAALKDVREAGMETLHFAWAGALQPGEPHYFRIHGPTALIEYDNTQNGANHVHSVWIDPQDVFGRDLLKKHYDHDH